jgi:hypothetical protein
MRKERASQRKGGEREEKGKRTDAVLELRDDADVLLGFGETDDRLWEPGKESTRSQHIRSSLSSSSIHLVCSRSEESRRGTKPRRTSSTTNLVFPSILSHPPPASPHATRIFPTIASTSSRHVFASRRSSSSSSSSSSTCPDVCAAGALVVVVVAGDLDWLGEADGRAVAGEDGAAGRLSR